MDRIVVGAAEFSAGAFPQVCAMTGRQAETWRTFRFATSPPGAYDHGLISLVSRERRVTGRLPLSTAADRKLSAVTWVPVGFIVLGAAVAGTAALIGTESIVGATSLFLGVFTVAVAGVLLIAMRPFVGPQGRILGSKPGEQREQIEISRIHPAFVAAVNQQHAVRPAQ